MTSSRLPVDPSTMLPSLQTFGELSQFLRSAVADEEALQMGESMVVMAQHIEAIVGHLRNQPDPPTLAGMLMDLLTVLRQHRGLVIELNPAWRELYEYASYFSALNHFRVLTGQWAMEATQPDARSLLATDFELVAWRMLGEGAMLIDVYEQSCGREARPEVESPDASMVARARSWWAKLGR